MKKIALVIGGSSGIGYETIKLLLTQDCLVYNASRRRCTIEQVINYAVDVTNKQSVIACLKDIITKHSSIDYVIYSAGFSIASSFEKTSESDYRYLWEVNFFGVVKFLKQILPLMQKANFGRFIVVGSIASDAMIPFGPFYCASKSALNAVIKNINFEYNKYNIYITSVLPGGTKTNFTYKRKVIQTYTDSFNNALKKITEIEQRGDNPQKVARLIVKVLNSKKPKSIVVTGLKNKLNYHLSKSIPVNLSQKIVIHKFKLKNDHEIQK